MKKFIIIFYLITSNYVAQNNDFKFGVCNDLISKSNSQLKYNLFLTGEYHLQEGNFKISISYFDYLLSLGLSPSYIIDESPPSFCYLLNKYFVTGDEFILNIIDDNLNRRQLYRNYRAFYLSLPDDKKFKYVGVDFEQFFQIAHYAVKDILMQCKVNCNYSNVQHIDYKTDSIISKLGFCDILQSFKLVENPLLFSNRDLKKDLDNLLMFARSQDSLFLQNNLTPNLYHELFQILKSYEISKKRKRLFVVFESDKFQVEREQFMTNNIYQLFAKEPEVIVYGQFGLDHVLLSTYKKHSKPHEKIRLAIVLNTDIKYPLTNNKVCSNVIYYNYFEPKKYYFLQSDLSNIKNELDKMKDCQLKVINFENKSRANNLILFKR